MSPSRLGRATVWWRAFSEAITLHARFNYAIYIYQRERDGTEGEELSNAKSPTVGHKSAQRGWVKCRNDGEKPRLYIVTSYNIVRNLFTTVWHRLLLLLFCWFHRRALPVLAPSFHDSQYEPRGWCARWRGPRVMKPRTTRGCLDGQQDPAYKCQRRLRFVVAIYFPRFTNTLHYRRGWGKQAKLYCRTRGYRSQCPHPSLLSERSYSQHSRALGHNVFNRRLGFKTSTTKGLLFSSINRIPSYTGLLHGLLFSYCWITARQMHILLAGQRVGTSDCRQPSSPYTL